MSIQAGKDTQGEVQQRTLQQTEERFRTLIQHSTDAIVLITESGIISYASESIQAVLGYTPAECIGTAIFSYLHPDEIDYIQGKLAEVLQAPGAQVTLEYRARHKNGSWVWLEATGSNYLHDPLVRAIIGNFRNITKRKHIEFALQQEKERQRLLNEASAALVSSLDHHFTLHEIARMIVPAFADYCRIALLDDRGEIKEITVDHVDPEQVPLVQALYEEYKDRASPTYGLRKLLETGQPELISEVSESVLQSAGGNPGLLRIVRALGLKSYMGTPLIARNRVIGALTFSSTQPDRHYTQEDFFFAQELARRIALTLDNARMYQEAQQAIAIRDDFISIASHELRTPITSLKMYTQILQKQMSKQGDDRLSHALARMDAQLNKLNGLISDLLNISKIEHGRLELQEEWFNLDELVRETCDALQQTTSKHTIHIEGSIPSPIWGDKDRIGQVVTNLLTNAIKYSPRAHEVLVRLRSEQDAAVVSVQDFGIGIAPEHLSKIFTRFYRVSDAEEKTFPGLGIGLYLSHVIITRHGGSLSVASEKGKGSLFSFSLPYHSSMPPTP